jgi:hypothetical protein
MITAPGVRNRFLDNLRARVDLDARESRASRDTPRDTVAVDYHTVDGAAAEGQAAPFDRLVLGILPKRLGYGSVEARVGRKYSGRLGGGRVDARVQQRRAQREDVGIVHVEDDVTEIKVDM